MNDVTTTRNGFRVEDITFKNARRQCEIDNEVEKSEETEDSIQAPVSLDRKSVV